jgi:hypothetical protein
LRLFDVAGLHASSKTGGRSLSNIHEVDAVIYLIDQLVRNHPKVSFCSRIGVITPYKHQMKTIRSRLTVAYGPSVLEAIAVNTVDGFQGQEFDVVLLSTVRGASGDSSSTSLGFLADERRMNVALTRARYSLLVVGNAQALSKGHPTWCKFVDHTKERNQLLKLPSPIPQVTGPIPDNLKPREYHVDSTAIVASQKPPVPKSNFPSRAPNATQKSAGPVPRLGQRIDSKDEVFSTKQSRNVQDKRPRDDVMRTYPLGKSAKGDFSSENRALGNALRNVNIKRSTIVIDDDEPGDAMAAIRPVHAKRPHEGGKLIDFPPRKR